MRLEVLPANYAGCPTHPGGHAAGDVASDNGTLALSMRGGLVVRTFTDNPAGWPGGAVVVLFTNGQLGIYGHVAADSSIVVNQTLLKPGGVVGAVAWDNHIHYELIDHLPFALPANSAGYQRVNPVPLLLELRERAKQ